MKKVLAWLSGFVFCLSMWAAKHCPAQPWSTLIGIAVAVALGVLAARR